MARQYLDDAFGPDGIRVTIAIEPAVAQLGRFRETLSVPTGLPGTAQVRRFRDDVLQYLGVGRQWLVRVESDSGRRARHLVPDRTQALELAKTIWRDVVARGVVAVEDAR